MKANEIRLGNWLYGTDGKPNKVNVDAIKYLLEYGETTLCQVYPIQITEEVLLKCGFASENGALFLHFQTGNEGGDYFYSYSPFISVGLSYGHDSEGGALLCVNFLHQLQNLYFALTGQELTYTP